MHCLEALPRCIQRKAKEIVQTLGRKIRDNILEAVRAVSVQGLSGCPLVCIYIRNESLERG